MSLPAVSKHIRVLERAGLVVRSVDGRVHTCALDGERLRDAAAWLDRYRAFWDDTLAALAEFAHKTK
jgi:DNA-binding transcriptional ArsR family regulator